MLYSQKQLTTTNQNMNVLFQLKEPAFGPEVLEFSEGTGNNVFISHSSEESIRLLAEHTIDKAVISIKNLRDAAILKYLNDYYPTTEVIVLANKSFDEIMSLFQRLDYSVIHEPLRLSDLKTKLKAEMKE